MHPALAEESVGIRLALPSVAHNVAVVRAAATAVSESLDFGDELTADVKTVISEACNNVSLHAYPDGETGPMWVEIECLPSGIRVAVTDRGRGITQISQGQDRMGLGLGVINALSDRSEFRKPSRGGFRVQMWFERPLATLAPESATHVGVSPPPPEVFAPGDGEIVLWCTGQQLQRSVLTRVLAYVAAAAYFSVGGIASVRSAAAALADHVQSAAEDGWAGACITSSPRRLSLSVGPLLPTPLGGQLLASTQTQVHQPIDGHELLAVTIADQNAPSR
jgi:serine/threonine-protein kinase RsbW